jgi:hypothetical protein
MSKKKSSTMRIYSFQLLQFRDLNFQTFLI